MSISKHGSFVPLRWEFDTGEVKTAFQKILAGLGVEPAEIQLYFSVTRADGLCETPKNPTIDALEGIHSPGRDLTYLELFFKGANDGQHHLTMSFSTDRWWISWGGEDAERVNAFERLLRSSFNLSDWRLEESKSYKAGVASVIAGGVGFREVHNVFQWDIFVSHNQLQKPWVRLAVAQWRELGLRVFFDEDSIAPGDSIVAGIERGILGSRHVVLIMSPAAVASKWVAMETAQTIFADPDASERRLIPVILEVTDFKTIRPSVRGLKMVDLADADRREANYKQLLHSLGIDEPQAVDPPSWETAPGASPSGRRSPERAVASSDIESEERTNPNFRSRMVFENFVVGPSNLFAQAACKAVADAPAKTYNPLFIFGPPGLGKTHLMHAIGNGLHAKRPKTRILLVTGEELANAFDDAVQRDTLINFRKIYRFADVLLVEDVHFLAGKANIQEEFIHTFDALIRAHRQIVLSSDRAPSRIHSLDKRLIARFEEGLATELHPPDVETRLAILRKKLQPLGARLDPEVEEFLAMRIRLNIRRLEGALMRVASYLSLNTGVKLTRERLEDLLKDMLRDEVV